MNNEELEISIIMPCLNEAETVAECVQNARGWLARSRATGEVIVADNGSTDGSIELATQAGARVVNVPLKGYGSAIMGGIAAARGKYIIVGDSDGNHDLSNLDPFLQKLREGYEFVIGNRFAGGFEPNSIAWANRYIGNPGISWLARLLFPSQIGDFLCGLRGLNREKIQKLNFRSTGMDLSIEMGVVAVLNHLKITEVPTRQLVSGRSRKPHNKPIQDGWKHVRFLFLNSPRWLFFQPGLLLMALGLAGSLALNQNTKGLAIFATLGIIGYQSILSGLFSTSILIRENIMPPTPLWRKFRAALSLERGLLIGILVILAGLCGGAFGLIQHTEASLRCLIASLAIIALGAQTMLASLVLGIKEIKN